MEKKLYLTKQVDNKMWYYVGDPLHPTSTLDIGAVSVIEKNEIKVDKYGAYVTRLINN